MPLPGAQVVKGFLVAALLGSAVIHASWNLLLKTTHHRRPVVWWALIVTNLCCAVILIARPHSITPVWPLLLLSERPSAFGILGILLIAVGIGVVGWSGRIGKPSQALALSLLLAV